jgi:nicotinate-nucleotide pyrophosphorylase (carboxylating)
VQDAFPADQAERMIVEVEVDTLEQLDQVLASEPDIVLLDNMSLDELREAVARRDQLGVTIALEASGRVDLHTVAAIAETGVDAISVGAMTHSAPRLDVGLDWREG